MIPLKSATFRAAPPIKPPSTSGLANTAFGLGAQFLLLRNLPGGDVGIGRNGPAVRAVEQVLLLEQVQVLADGDGGDPEPKAQGPDIDAARRPEQIEYGLVSFTQCHTCRFCRSLRTIRMQTD